MIIGQALRRRQRPGTLSRVGHVDVERIRALGRGLVIAGAVLAFGAFTVGWSIPHPAVSAVVGFVAVGAGPPLAGLAMMRTTSPGRLYTLVSSSGLVSTSALAVHLLMVYLAGFDDLSTALGTFVYIVLILVPVVTANAMTTWLTYFHYRRTRQLEPVEEGNEQTRSGV